jgi:2-polyprenyl-6-methoxyphenol hydroxylase-like FAD-dependent oxidoreductase
MQCLQPYNGNGTSTALWDCLAVVTLLQSIKTASEIPRAFEIYDGWRRPLRQLRAKAANEWAAIYNGESDNGVDLSKWRKLFGVVPNAVPEKATAQHNDKTTNGTVE